MSVLLVAVGLYLTNNFNRDQLSLQRESIREQQDLALRGQRADRFVAAVDQLGQEGADKLSIRLGGIYALETLMNDSPQDEDTAIEVLCAFVRTHAPRPKKLPEPTQIPETPADIQAAISVMVRRPDPAHHVTLDLNNTLLGPRGANLGGADLGGADLGGANLFNAYLFNADLFNADLGDANLFNAYLGGADLGGASLVGADLTGADLVDANLVDANLVEADLRGANLRRADLRGTDLRVANLVGANLDCAQVDVSTQLPPYVIRPAEDAKDSPECKKARGS